MRLARWVIRAVIPVGLIGTYILHRGSSPVYVGRSDTDLRRRLLEHSARARGEYFSYDVHYTSEQAFEVECSLFHALRPALTNVLHPDRPNHLTSPCPFCLDTLGDVLGNRLRTPNL
ncbi:hypothetical protein Aph01nite_67980 [Acrocarpospora phusangensis]|uniref:GIY-YIG domain-containing protein n=1 Tax=Acrocarpospora phusangensis TaxID=1070424 RepID=A0A919USC3_9ACTN|nr:GIY-YIG nuclease family protein [Acrocarpospora phusangensis]GIH28488.1 hypothetical protein Aph01nite_67980 [Acrocarpospora phusangensis]